MVSSSSQCHNANGLFLSSGGMRAFVGGTIYAALSDCRINTGLDVSHTIDKLGTQGSTLGAYQQTFDPLRSGLFAEKRK